MNYDLSFSSLKELVTFMNCMVTQSPKSIFLVNGGYHQETSKEENLGEYYNLADFTLRLFRRRFNNLELEGKVFFYSCKCLTVNPQLDFPELVEAIYEGIHTGYFHELAELNFTSAQQLILHLLDGGDQGPFGTVVGHIQEDLAMIGLVDRQVFESLMVGVSPAPISC